MSREGELLAVQPDGTWEFVPNTYEGVKQGMRGATIDFVIAHDDLGFFINDNGMLDGSPLNIAASVFAQRPLYGPVVACAPEPDDEGETLAADEGVINPLRGLARFVENLHKNAALVGQTLDFPANPDTIPPARIVSFEEHFGGN